MAAPCGKESKYKNGMNYASVVRRWGLVGGYLWRCIDLVRRHGRTLRKFRGDRHSLDADRANFGVRQALCAWVCGREE